MRKPTISEIKRKTAEREPHFFTRSSMKFFGQKLKDFKVEKTGGRYSRIKAPMHDSRGQYMGDTERIYNPDKGELIHKPDAFRKALRRHESKSKALNKMKK